MQTIKISDGTEVSFSPQRGGIITSIKLKGVEILYLDKETFSNTDMNVRGGIPILFPNAGALESNQYPDLKQHGFVRNSSEWTFESTEKGFIETLVASDETKKVYPYDFKLTIEGKFEVNGSFTLIQTAENLDKEMEMPIAMGLHPYFKVARDERKNVKFNFEGGKSVEEQSDMWINGQYASVDNPKVKDSSAILDIVIPGVGTLLMDVSAEYKKIWIWSLLDADFICIEPVMRDVGGLVTDPEQVGIGEVLTASVNINLK